MPQKKQNIKGKNASKRKIKNSKKSSDNTKKKSKNIDTLEKTTTLSRLDELLNKAINRTEDMKKNPFNPIDNLSNKESNTSSAQQPKIPPELMPLLMQQIKKTNKLKNAIIALLLLAFFASFIINFSLDLKLGNVARIKIYEPITFEDRYTDAQDIVEWLNEIEKNPRVKAIILDINSPGGSAAATWMIVKKLEEIKKERNITIVALINEIGTSGAYWIAATADKIFANKLSITGSIGVLGSFVTFEGLLKRYNITYQRIIAGKYKDLGIPFKDLTETERELLLKKINLTYEFFIKSIAELRHLNESYVRKLATGEFYTGEEAKGLRLIDDFGTYEDVLNYLRNKLNTTIKVDTYEKSLSVLDEIMNMMSKANFKAGQEFARGFYSEMKSKMLLE